MKKILLLLMMLPASMGVWAEDYITDVMVIGGSKSEINALKSTYTTQGWTVVDQDLNAGCGSGSDYIYLLYKKGCDSVADVGSFITNFVISTATGTIPDNVSYGDRTYHLVPFDGSDYFKGNKGDLNSHCGSSSATIHLYFTRDYDPDGKDYSTVKSIAFNDTQAGGVTTTSGITGYDLNTGCGSSSDYIYMHTDKAQGWIITKNTAGTECFVKGFDGPKTIFKDIFIPYTIDGATVLGFSGMDFSGFTNLETMKFPDKSSVEQMPSLRGCSKFYNVKTGGGNFTTPNSMTRIPGYAFAGTAIKKIQFASVTSVGINVFEGCDSLSSVSFKKSPVMIDYGAFDNINTTCTVNYPGSIDDWNPLMYMYSPHLVVKNDISWACGWCGDVDEIDNHLYWTLQNNHLRIDCATDIWDTNPGAQYIWSYSWSGIAIKAISLNHVHLIDIEQFKNHLGVENVYINPTLRYIGSQAFKGCSLLRNIWFDGNEQQWNAVGKHSNWKGGTSSLVEHWHCTVTFNANGHGTAPAPQNIEWSNQDKATEPAAPTAEGYEFKGWYKEAACNNAWNFNDVIPRDMTLYAGWEIQQFAITLPESFEHGSVNCDKTEAAEGETVTLTVTPDDGYELETLTVTIVDGDPSGVPRRAPLRANVDLISGENATYIFLMPAAPVTVSATFMETASLRGDVNEDDKVDVSDVNMMINMILGKQDETAAADLDGSGNVDVSDVNELINIILGK